MAYDKQFWEEQYNHLGEEERLEREIKKLRSDLELKDKLIEGTLKVLDDTLYYLGCLDGYGKVYDRAELHLEKLKLEIAKKK